MHEQTVSRMRTRGALIRKAMKSYNHLLEEIVTDENLNDSFDQIVKAGRKSTPSGRYLIKKREEVIKELKSSIGNGLYRIPSYKTFYLIEGGKEREIQSIPLKDRIALNAIMKIVEKYVIKRFVLDSAASIKGRGTHYLLKRILRDRERDPDGTRYIYKCDVKKFYQSIDQDLMIMILRRTFREKPLLDMLESFVRFLPNGLSIGLRSSQLFGNMYLDYFLDHVIKDEYGIKYFKRYCDDIMVQASSYTELVAYKNIIHNCLNKAKLTIKPNEQMFDVHNRPIDFLGFKVYYDGRIRLRKHIKQRFARR